MIVKEYCESMNRQLVAWRANVEKLLLIAEALLGSSPPSADDHQQREKLQSLIDDIGRVADMLKQECLVA